MTATFADYVAQQDARNTIQLNVTKWTLMLCDGLRDAAPSGYDYIIESGRKYHKIIMVDSGKGRSVHAFVDRKTGQLYKSASWKSPAKGVRYDLRLIEQREWLLEHADWAGGYLYAK
jgi:phage-related protein